MCTKGISNGGWHVCPNLDEVLPCHDVFAIGFVFELLKGHIMVCPKKPKDAKMIAIQWPLVTIGTG